jgi:hypothetical protein
MPSYRISTAVSHDGSLTVRGFPLPAGEGVEAIVMVRSVESGDQPIRRLWGLPVSYKHPTEPVADSDWEV